MKKNHIFLRGTYSNPTPYLFYQKILHYFSDLQNKRLSVLWLKWTQKIEMKQNQIFFHCICVNLTPYFFLPKNIKVFQSLTKSKILSFMIKVKPNNENETKSDIFPSDIFKSDVKFHWAQNTDIFQWLS